MKIDRLLSRLARGALYFPRTVYINFRTLPVKKALKFPYIVMGPCSFRGLNRRSLILDAPVKTAMIRIAAQKTSKRGIPINRRTSILLDSGGSITFHGEASIGAGSAVCASGGRISFGDRFSCNVNCFFYSMRSITVGEDVLLGWDIRVRDNDGHPLFDREGNRLNEEREIVLKDHVWIASYADIMKGVSLAEGTIVGTRSLVTGSTEEKHLVIAGIPARPIRHDVYWEHRGSDIKSRRI